MSFTSKQMAFIGAARVYDENVVAIDLNSVSKIDLQNIADSAGLKFPHWITRVNDYKAGRGLWSIPVNGAPAIKAGALLANAGQNLPASVKAPDPIPKSVPAAPVTVIEMTKGGTSTVENIPVKDNLFVPFGNFSDVHSILKSEMF